MQVAAVVELRWSFRFVGQVITGEGHHITPYSNTR